VIRPFQDEDDRAADDGDPIGMLRVNRFHAHRERNADVDAIA
jgi:hypothetical protein